MLENKYKFKNKEYSINELVEVAQREFNNELLSNTIYNRILAQWPIEKILKTPTTKKYKYKNKKYTLTELVRIAKKEFNNKIKLSTLRTRIKRNNWPIEIALKTPIRSCKSTKFKKSRVRYEFEGKTYHSQNELILLAKERFNNKISKTALQSRIRMNWPLEKTLKESVKKRNISNKHKKYFYNNKYYTVPQLHKIATKEFNNNISYATLLLRIKKRNWPIEKALKTFNNINLKINENIYYYNNKKYTAKQLQQLAVEKFNNHISINALRNRLKYLNWSIEKAIQTPNKHNHKHN